MWGQDTPILSSSQPLQAGCEGDAVITQVLPVFRSGKCSGGSREVLGTGGRKVLSTGGEGPSGSRGSRDLQGEGTLLETFPNRQPHASHAMASNASMAHGTLPFPGMCQWTERLDLSTTTSTYRRAPAAGFALSWDKSFTCMAWLKGWGCWSSPKLPAASSG